MNLEVKRIKICNGHVMMHNMLYGYSVQYGNAHHVLHVSLEHLPISGPSKH